MSWFAGEDGEQIWVDRDSVVYTVDSSVENLPLEHLSYLALTTKKAVYQEAMCDDDLGGSKSKRNKDKTAGKQRGFIIRTDVEESPLTRVVPQFKAAAKKLMDCSVVSRVDADESSNVKKKKKNDKAAKDASAESARPKLGAGECRVTISCKIHHFAHGPGYRVEVAEGDMMQRLHMFTCRKEVQAKDWLALLLSALESTGSHVMILRRDQANGNAAAVQQADSNVERGAAEKTGVTVQVRKSKAQQDENEWLQSLMGNCDVAPDEDTGAERQGEPNERTRAAAPAAKTAAAPATASTQRLPPKVPADASRWDALAPSKPRAAREERHQSQKGSAQGKGQKSGYAKQPQVRTSAADPRQPTGPSSRGTPAAAPWAWVNGLHKAQGASAVKHVEPSPTEQIVYEDWEQSWESSAAESWSAWSSGNDGRHGRGSSTDDRQWQQDSWYLQNAWQPAAPQHRVEPQAAGGSRAPARTCGECGRGRPLKLFEDDGGWYCRMCWVQFYGVEPPGRS